MVLKMIGSIMVIISSSILGYLLSEDCSKRPLQLKTLQNMIQMLENEIRFLSSCIPDAFKRIGQSTDDPVAYFFIASCEYLTNDSGLNASKSWEMAVENNIWNTALNKEDKGILINFGRMLGNSDSEGQIKNIRLLLEQLSLQEEKAEENKKKNETLYKTIGFLGGIATVLALI